MTRVIPEHEYEDFLWERLCTQYGNDAVRRQVYLPEVGRYCDLVVDAGVVDLAIEVENSTNDVVTNGVAQALLYGSVLDAVPVVVHPSDGRNEAELNHVDDRVTVVEIPHTPA